jgi:zona occludens toxin
MAISAYNGWMGAGKTYEVVAYVLLPAILEGRRVVTNISGATNDKLREYCSKQKNVDLDKIGYLESVTDDQIKESGFFPTSTTKGFVQPGDLIIIDEAWRFFAANSKISAEHMEFFRMHRHYVHEDTRICCDIVLISQEIGDIHRSIKSVIELSFRAKKLKTLGLNKCYVVEMWEGTKQSRKSAKAQNRKYNSDIFAIYKSYSQGDGPGKEVSVDKRQNVLNSWRVYIGIPALIIFAAICFYHTFSFFRSSPKTPDPIRTNTIASPNQNYGTPSNDFVPPVRVKPRISTTWRLAGYFSSGDRKLVILVHNTGRVRYEHASGFTFEDNRPVVGIVDDERVTPWSGTLTQTDTLTSAFVPPQVKD